ncbi:RICIN domain-containing protein [Catenulispora sp. NF23]|uniref:RICIN domain-containing protein n=1 Tax=Catenulispora pinistramenti TaxID=2705254 RepID=A0ABS5KM76_9ACTN|nr:RICIN domain-containing protein [Catenulispora pinistramenti]MBS2531705.1 RICIN domain-containing protein [Catenulispora pinistramenti]MBS2547124.1 RICIN domain-containing protein [Catenulispora pinistramenti]
MGRRRRLALVTAAAAACAFAGFTATATASTARPSGNSPIYTIISKSSGKDLDVSGSVHNGANLIIYHNHNGTNQHFRIVGDSVENPHQVEIQTLRAADGLIYCVWGDTVPGQSFGDASVQLCNGSQAEQFVSVPSNDVLYIAFQNIENGQCLDVQENGQADGTQVGLYACGENQLNQLWHAAKQ